MYTHHMRKEHGESKCSHNERHIWNLNKCFFFWNIQKLESIRPLHPYVVSMTAPWTLDFPHGFPRGPTRRDATQALAFGEVMQVDRGRWRVKTQNCRKVVMIDAHGFVYVPFKTTRCQDSLRRWNQNGMVNICRVTKQRWWNYSEFQSWNGWHRTLVSAQSHITYLRFQAWLQPNLLRSNQHVTWTSPLTICFIERLDPSFLERALPRRSWMDSEHEIIVRPPLSRMQPLWKNFEGPLISYWIYYSVYIYIYGITEVYWTVSLKHSRICAEHSVSWLPVCLFLPAVPTMTLVSGTSDLCFSFKGAHFCWPWK